MNQWFYIMGTIIRKKPIRFGFKVLMTCKSNGYRYRMEIYAGKQLDGTVPLGPRLVN